MVVWDFFHPSTVGICFQGFFLVKPPFQSLNFKSRIRFIIYESKIIVNRKGVRWKFFSTSQSWKKKWFWNMSSDRPKQATFPALHPPLANPQQKLEPQPWQGQLPTSTRLSRRLGSFWVTNTSLFLKCFFRRWKVNPLSPTPQITGLIKRWWWYPYPPDV